MAVMLITYDLNNPGQKYPAVHDAIKSAGTTWCHPLESTWLIVTSSSTGQVAQKLKAAGVDDNDSLLVVDVTRDDRNGWLPDEAANWIRVNWPG
ncbi:hypothetical protein [Phycicoccus avicenniae]|uniref:hypothetical protein n=1 Tax=Phycicoccus avicenniae TaxID=2828860 RepID=UPI003D2816BF